jgi:glycosyltransferase involved in cell wall biosynthesis
MSNTFKVIMAESSDIFHDGRVLKEASTLQKQGYLVEILGFRNIHSQRNKYPFSIRTFLIASKKTRLLRNFSILANIIFINFILLFRKANAYHAHNTMFLPGMYFASKLYGGRFIYDSHEVQHELNILAKNLELLFIKKADFIINVSEGRADYQAQRFNIPRKKIVVVSNYPEIPENICTITHRSSKDLSFVFSGGFNLEDNKLDNFILALSEFDNCKFYLLAFGYGSSKEKLIESIKVNKLEDKVYFLDLVEPNRVVSIISQFDIAVNLLYNPKNLISYKYHGINKMYEYLLAGLPILTSNMPSFIEDFENNNVGKAVDPLEISSIKEGIQYFIKLKENELGQMKRDSQELAIKKFNWESQANTLIDLYKILS